MTQHVNVLVQLQVAALIIKLGSKRTEMNMSGGRSKEICLFLGHLLAGSSLLCPTRHMGLSRMAQVSDSHEVFVISVPLPEHTPATQCFSLRPQLELHFFRVKSAH